MSADTKNKINTLAKDFGVKSKDLVKIFEDNGMDVKNRMSALRDEEVNFAYEYFSKATPIEDIDKYLSGEIKVNYPEPIIEKKDKKRIGKIAVCSAGTADIPVAEEAAQVAEYFGSYYYSLQVQSSYYSPFLPSVYSMHSE